LEKILGSAGKVRKFSFLQFGHDLGFYFKHKKKSLYNGPEKSIF
jgi:hypothetical protein